MVTDKKIRISIYLKLLFVFSYILYAVFMYLKESDLEIKSKSMSDKNFLLDEVCLSILGGSNAKWGISAEQLHTQHCAVKNYGVDNEGGSFENYNKWYSKNLKSKTVIYSSYLFLADEVDYQANSNIFPATSIISQVKKVLTNKLEAPKAEYNLFGDLVNYDCRSPMKSFEIKKNNFLKNSKSIGIEVNRRLKLIAETTNAKEILLRIPPVYVDNKNLKNYKSLMKKRVEIFREMGINVIETSIASSDKSLFCDATHHPNAKGRLFFTNELKDKLKIY